MSDFTPSLNNVRIESPTEDGKIAYVMNTMVPRRLEQFDDIRADLENKNFDTDKAYFYVNFQAGDFCGRSYKLPLSELNEFVTKSLLFGTNGKDPVINFDKNFYIDEDNTIHLLLSADGEVSDELLRDIIEEFRINDVQLDYRLGLESTDREAGDAKLDAKKNDKLIVIGSGDKQDPTSRLPIPKADSEGDPYGVHVTYDPPGYTGLDLGDGTTGPVILIDHDFKLPWDLTCAYNIGGLARDQYLEKGTPITEII